MQLNIIGFFYRHNGNKCKLNIKNGEKIMEGTLFAANAEKYLKARSQAR